MRIEPKTFFANERTFIQWMSFMIIIQGIGFGLMRYVVLSTPQFHPRTFFM